MANGTEPPEDLLPDEQTAPPPPDDLSIDDQAAADMLEAALAAQDDAIPDQDDPPATDPEEIPPGTGEPHLDLPRDQLDELGSLLTTLLDEHDLALSDRWVMLDRVMDNYNLVYDQQRGGLHPFSARLCSPLTKEKCDQVKARLSGSFRNTKDLIKVEPADPEAEPNPGEPDPLELARSTEYFLSRYSESEIQLRRNGPLWIQSGVQTGTAACRDMWEEEVERVYFYNDAGDKDYEDVRYAGIRSRNIHYRDLVLWPIDADDWQRDYQIVGHRGRKMTKAEYERRLRDWGYGDEEITEFTANPTTPDPDVEKQRRDADHVDEAAVTQDTWQIYELWLHMAIGPLEYGKYQVFLDRDRQRVLWADYNSLHCQLHPYMDLHYKEKAGFAFSEGVGEELIQSQAIASTILNMKVDNWKTVGNHVVFYDENSVTDNFFTEIYPGKKQGVAGNPNESIRVEALGGPLEALQQAEADNQMDAMRAAGLPPLMSGTGDPVMKSGADSTSVMALLSEAGRKIGDIDQTIKECFSRRVEFWLELLAQYAPEGFFYSHLSPRRALPMEALKYKPPRGRIKGRFKISVVAPSPSSNREIQKQAILILDQMADNYLIFVERVGMEIYSAEGQQEQLLDLKRQIFNYKTELWALTTELHEVPGLTPMQPTLAEPTPEEEKIDQLRSQLTQAVQQLQSISLEANVYKRTAEIMGQFPETPLPQAQEQARNEVEQAIRTAAEAQSNPAMNPGGQTVDPSAPVGGIQ